MTTIRSTNGTASLSNIRPSGANPALVHVDINVRGVGACSAFPTADLAAALGLITREERDSLMGSYQFQIDEKMKAIGMLDSAERERDALRAELDEAEKALAAVNAELDEAEATIARVREVVENFLDPHHQGVVVAARVAEKLRAALDPKPAFVLPTEVPATIEAKRIHFGWTSRLVLWTDGTERFWRAEYDGQDYTEAGVMDGMFTDHRLIVGES